MDTIIKDILTKARSKIKNTAKKHILKKKEGNSILTNTLHTPSRSVKKGARSRGQMPVADKNQSEVVAGNKFDKLKSKKKMSIAKIICGGDRYPSCNQ